MKITQADIAAAKVAPVNDYVKILSWGRSPFPEGFVPILAITNVSSPIWGILMRARTTGRFMIGTAGALKNISDNFAMELMSKADVDDTRQCCSWGGNREGAGRPKTVPEDAKRRSIYMTEEEFKYVKKWLEDKRNV